jgi:uncharacterized protein (DUF849 family)
MASEDATRPLLLQACLNGSRNPADHPAVPLDPAQLALAAAESVTAGAAALHIHQRDASGAQTLDSEPCAESLRAIRAACPGVPVGLTTGAWIEPDPDRRLQLVSAWEVLPDYASVNLREDGAVPLLRLLLDRGIGVEAGVWTVEDVEILLAAGETNRCLRVLLEAMEEDPAEALANVAAMESRLDEAGCTAPQLQHGVGSAAWPVLVRAIDAGRDSRIGLEDTVRLPDGRTPSGNAELVAAAVRLAEEARRPLALPVGGVRDQDQHGR